MGWLYNLSYFGPDRRGKRGQRRFIERRRDVQEVDRSLFRERLRDLCKRGLRWINHVNYFGPDRRSGGFSHFILERRQLDCAGSPPPLGAALRQLRVRVLEADDETARAAFRERLIATALLAEANGQNALADRLRELDAMCDGAGRRQLSARMQVELVRAEDLLAEHDQGAR